MPRPGFAPVRGAIADEDERNSTAETGTEDVLLFGDIVEALVQTAVPVEGTPCANAAELAARLGEARLEDDRIVPGPAGHSAVRSRRAAAERHGRTRRLFEADVE